MTKKISLKIREDLLKNAQIIAEKKFKHRDVSDYSKVSKEILIDFVEQNENLLKTSF